MKKYLLLLSLLAPILLASSAVNFSQVGNLGGYQGSDPTSYTPTFTGFGTVSTQSFRWSRIGPFVLVQGTFTAGTVAGTLAGVSLPSGLTADASLGTNQVVGSYAVNVAATGHFNTLISGGGTSIGVGYTDAGGSGGIAPNNGNVVAATGNLISINALIPISGWSSTTPNGTTLNSELSRSNANGLGSTNTSVIKWGTSQNLVGSNLSYTETAANGGYVGVGATGIYSITLVFGDSNATTTVGIAIDTTGSALSNGGTTLAGNPRLLGYTDGMRAQSESLSSTSYTTLHWTGHLSSGAKIYFLSNSGTSGNANAQFTVTQIQ